MQTVQQPTLRPLPQGYSELEGIHSFFEPASEQITFTA